jgi:hypothetical protein
MAGAVVGVAHRPDGSAAAGAQATLSPAAGLLPGSSSAVAADGSFGFTGVTAGPYALQIADSATNSGALLGGLLVQGTTLNVGTLTLSTAPASLPPPSPGLQKPIANAGPDQLVTPGTVVVLDGGASQGTRLVFHWASAPTVSFRANDSTAAARTTFVAPDLGGVLRISLVVEDGFGTRSAPAAAQVIVDHPPVAMLKAVPAQVSPSTSTVAVQVTLDASASTDADGDPLIATFQQTGGPPITLAQKEPLVATFAAPQSEGVLHFIAQVSDGRLTTASAAIEVDVVRVDHPPTALINSVSSFSTTVVSGTAVQLDASKTTDPDPGEAPPTIQWAALGGAPAPTTTSNPLLVTVYPPTTPGTYYQYKLTATDSGPSAAASTAFATIICATPPPPPLPPAPKIIAVSPADASTNVTPFTTMEVDYDKPLDAINVPANAITASAGGAPIAGTSAYSNSGGTGGVPVKHAIVFTPASPLPAGASVTVNVPALLDPYGQQSPAKSWRFSVRGSLSWVNRTPPSPLRACSYSGAPAGGCDFGFQPFAAALASGASGSYLLTLEFGVRQDGTGSVDDAVLRIWNPAQNGNPSTPGWDIAPDYNSFLRNSQNQMRAMGGNSFFGGWQHAWLGIDPNGFPLAGFEIGPDNYWYQPATTGFGNAGTLGGLALINDGSTSYAVFRVCGNFGFCCAGPYYMGVYLAPVSRYPNYYPGPPTDVALGPAGPIAIQTQSGMWCSGNQNLTGEVAAASTPGKVYLLFAVAPALGAAPAMSLYVRSTTASAFSLVVGGIQSLPVGWLSTTAMVPSSRGPAFAFVEGSGSAAQIRVGIWDEVAAKSLDPLGSASGSSAISPATLPLPNPYGWTQPGPPAIAAIGTTVYVAFTATGGLGGHRVFVAHSDAGKGSWVLDRGSNADGSMNAYVGCDAGIPAVGLVESMPTVAWDEPCPIPNQSQTINHFVVVRLE